MRCRRCQRAEVPSPDHVAGHLLARAAEEDLRFVAGALDLFGWWLLRVCDDCQEELRWALAGRQLLTRWGEAAARRMGESKQECQSSA